MRVKPVLKAYVGGVHMGEPPAPPWSRTELTSRLAGVSRANHFRFQVCFVVLLLLFTASCALVMKFMHDPGRLGALFALTGVAIVALVAQMVSLWKQKVTADVVAVLAHHLQPADARGVIEILFAKL
jgi:hypothetical protein